MISTRLLPSITYRKPKADILLAHGDCDIPIPLTQGQALEKASNREKSHLWIVLDKGHSNWESHPEFWARIEDFMKKYLPVS